MKKTPYKSLDQLVGGPDERVPLSTRVKKDTKTFLNREAKVRNLTSILGFCHSGFCGSINNGSGGGIASGSCPRPFTGVQGCRAKMPYWHFGRTPGS